jgi:hypothetical protein
MLTASFVHKGPVTAAVRQALQGVNNSLIEADLLFLEAWEMQPSSQLGATLRASQIRRANPGLAAAIDAELKAVAKSALHMPKPDMPKPAQDLPHL